MLKKNMLTITALLLTLCTGCSSAGKETSANDAAVQNTFHVVMTQTVEADSDYNAKTLSQLWEDSDFVAVASVDDVSSELITRTTLVQTTVKLSDVRTYKGEYTGGSFTLEGGYMRLKDYAAALPYLDFSAYSKADMESGYVCTRLTGTHIPEIKETLLIFAKYAPEEDVYYAFAGEKSIFVLDEASVILEGLASEENWTDPFAEDFTRRCNGTAEKTENGYVSVTCNWTELENVLRQSE